MSTKKILLVDDASTLLLLEQVVLQSAGYQILAAQDGEAGVRAALAHRPDLILLAVDPPETPGTPETTASEVCRQLRVHEATRAIPILLLAFRGKDKEKIVERGFPSGCKGCIIKPIDPNELLSKVRSLLGD